MFIEVSDLKEFIINIFYLFHHCFFLISWSRNGHKLLSASTDNNVCIWDVLSGECDQKYRFPSPILKVQFHPRNLNKFLVCPMRHAAVMVDVEGTHRVIPLDDDVCNKFNIILFININFLLLMIFLE